MKNVNQLLSSVVIGVFFTGLLTGCGSKSGSEANSSVKVTNGRRIIEKTYPSVVLLAALSARGESSCTGTFVNDSQLVTAAHCVDGLDTLKPLVGVVKEVNGEMMLGAIATSFVQHPDYRYENGVNQYDVAVINFPANSAPAVSLIAPAAPAPGTELTIVGYGNNENFLREDGEQSGSGAGSKRLGTNKVSQVDAGIIGFIGVSGSVSDVPEGELVASGSGDSGGPLFINNELAGVTSGGGLQNSELGLLSVSFYVDLNSSSVSKFLSSTLKSPRAVR